MSLNTTIELAAESVRHEGPSVGPHITSAELLAVDFVTIPSNRDAEVMAAKSLSELTGKQLVGAARRLSTQVLLELARDDLAEMRRIDLRTVSDARRELALLESFLNNMRRR